MSSKYDKTILMKFSKKKRRKNSGFIEIYGLHAVKAALNNSNRKHQKIVISQSHELFNYEKNYTKLKRDISIK